MKSKKSRKDIKLVGFNFCVEHPERDADEWHHVVPRSEGGSVMVPLCEECHNKVHSSERLSASHLIKKGLKKAQGRGVRVGRPAIHDDEQILILHEMGFTPAHIAHELNIQLWVIERAILHFEIIRLRSEGKTRQQIQQLLKTSDGVVSKSLQIWKARQ